MGLSAAITAMTRAPYSPMFRTRLQAHLSDPADGRVMAWVDPDEFGSLSYTWYPCALLAGHADPDYMFDGGYYAHDQYMALARYIQKRLCWLLNNY